MLLNTLLALIIKNSSDQEGRGAAVELESRAEVARFFNGIEADDHLYSIFHKPITVSVHAEKNKYTLYIILRC